MWQFTQTNIESQRSYYQIRKVYMVEIKIALIYWKNTDLESERRAEESKLIEGYSGNQLANTNVYCFSKTKANQVINYQ